MLLSHVTGEETETQRLNDLSSGQPVPAYQTPEPVFLRALLPATLANCPSHSHPGPGDWPLGPWSPEGSLVFILSPHTLFSEGQPAATHDSATLLSPVVTTDQAKWVMQAEDFTRTWKKWGAA